VGFKQFYLLSGLSRDGLQASQSPMQMISLRHDAAECVGPQISMFPRFASVLFRGANSFPNPATRKDGIPPVPGEWDFTWTRIQILLGYKDH